MTLVKTEAGGLLVIFDKAPKYLYANVEGKGCGEVAVNGEKVEHLISTNSKSKTLEGRPSFNSFAYEIRYYDKQDRVEKSRAYGHRFKDGEML